MHAEIAVARIFGSGAIAQRVRGLDWSATPLGSIERWPASLCTIASLVLASSVSSALLWGPEATVVAYNDAYRAVLGSKPEALGRSFWEVWAEVREASAVRVKRVLAGETFSVHEAHFTLLRGSGPEEAWFDYGFSPVYDDTGQVAGALVTCTEVTPKVLAETALRDSEARLRLIVETARDYAILTTDAEGRIETWSPGAEAIFGWSAPEVVGQPAAIIFTPEDRATSAPKWEMDTARAEGSAPDVRCHLRKNGSRVFIEGKIYALHGPGGIVRGFLKIGHDVTQRRQAEDTNARLAAIVESTPDAVISFAAEDGRILTWNQGAEALFGYTEAEARGGPAGLLVPPDRPDDGDPTGVFRRALAGDRVHQHETVRQTKLGERVAVTVTAARMLASDGRVIGVSAIFHDLRQRKAAEARQTLLAREVDHRAKNMLAVVQAALHLTRAPDLESYIRVIEGRVAALSRAHTLLADDNWAGADLLTLLRGELDGFCDSTGRTGPKVKLKGPEVVLPPGAAQPLAMAIHELATNAIKHGALSMPAGRVTVAWGLDAAPAGKLRLRWDERGGPPVEGVPARRGFGTRVLEATVRDQLGGVLTLTWESSGLVCNIETPLRRD